MRWQCTLVTHDLIEIFPIVLGHETEGTEECPSEVIEACVVVVRVLADSETRVVWRTLPVGGKTLDCDVTGARLNECIKLI